MIKNYFKIAWRNLLKNKLFSFINISGLGLALPFALISIMQVMGAFEADKFHPYPERSFRIITDVVDNNGSKTKYAVSPSSIALKLKQDYPFIENTTHVIRDFGWEMNNKVKTLRVNSVYVEPAFFEMFGFKIEKGNIPAEPNSLAITAAKAALFFGNENPVGKTLSHPSYGDFKITAVLKDNKKKSHLKCDVMVSMETFKKFSKAGNPTDLTGFSYVLLKPGANEKNIDAALAAVAAGINKQQAAGTETLQFRKQLLANISPAYEKLRENSYVDSMLDLSFNFAFAFGLILLAAFNYINLTLARSISRAKEVGIRKVAGALRYQLTLQFVCEAILIAMLSLGVGFLVLQLLKNFSYVNWFIWDVDNTAMLWLMFVLFAVFTGVVAGIIPARILSSIQPVKVLKGNISPASFGKLGVRNILVIVQFIVTSCFIFVMSVMYSQFKYMATDNENFNRKNIYNISVVGDYKLLKNDISQHKNVERVGLVSTPFGGTSAECFIKKNNQEKNAEASYYAVNADFVSNMKLSFTAGSNLPETNSDSTLNFVLLNEQAVTTLGLGTPAEAVGKSMLLNDEKEVMISGVVKDFCYFHYQFAPMPLVMQYNPSQFHVLSIKTKTTMPDDLFKSELNSIWKKQHPHQDLAFSNYEKDLFERYFPGADMKFIGVFCLIVLVIAIMGLLGIVTYSTEKRVKEIGIRKVMGASVQQIVKEISGGFIKLILIAALISLPLGYALGFFMLKLFVFNNGVNTGLMLLLFFFIFISALFTIGIKSLKTATINPVKSLRTE